jgi:Ca2+-binding RTX toxin-like protein
MARKFNKIWGDNTDEVIYGTEGRDLIRGLWGDDEIHGGDGDDNIQGGRGNDIIESGLGNDIVNGGAGDDLIYAFSWGGEPEIAQDPNAEKVEPGEPIEDDDIMSGGEGADTFHFRWLIDARDEILDAHRDESGDVDYQAVAGENGAAHDHWVETMGDKTITDFNPDEDTLVFEGHTVNLDETIHEDVNGDGVTDTVFSFISIQNGGGAHDGDHLGTLTILNHVVELDNNDINRGVFYGVEDPYSADL